MGAWPTSLALVPLATVVLMIGCNGRNHHSLLKALRYIPDDRIKYVAIVISLYILYHDIFSCRLSIWWPLATFYFSFELLTYQSLHTY